MIRSGSPATATTRRATALAAAAAVCHELEPRRLLSASIQVRDGTLYVYGTAGDDVIDIRGSTGSFLAEDGTQTPMPVLVGVNGRLRAVPGDAVRRIHVDAGNGDDKVTLGFEPFGESLAELAIDYRDIPSTILGGAGRDTLVGGDTADYISGGAGADYIGGDSGGDTLDGDGQSDLIVGGQGDDLIRGGRGDDLLHPTNFQGTTFFDDADTLDGGAGTDTRVHQDRARRNETRVEGRVDPDWAMPRYTLDDDGTLTVWGTRKGDAIGVSWQMPEDQYQVHVTNQVLFEVPADRVRKIRIFGLGGDDVILFASETAGYPYVGAGPARVPFEIYGGDGNDTITGSLSADTIYGEAGDDVLAGSIGADLIYGGDGADTLRGNAGNDTLDGGAGADRLDGERGDDSLAGGPDLNDTLFGGPGRDSFADGHFIETHDYSPLFDDPTLTPLAWNSPAVRRPFATIME